MSNAKALRDGRTRCCENVPDQEGVRDETAEVLEIARSPKGSTLRGTERDDNLLGGPGRPSGSTAMCARGCETGTRRYG